MCLPGSYGAGHLDIATLEQAKYITLKNPVFVISLAKILLLMVAFDWLEQLI
jgi:hypothetical protein